MFKIHAFTEISSFAELSTSTDVDELIGACETWAAQIDTRAVAVKQSIRTFWVVVRVHTVELGLPYLEVSK